MDIDVSTSLKIRAGLVIAGLISVAFWGGMAYGMDKGFAQGKETGYDLGYQNGTEDGELSVYQRMENSNPVFIVRQDFELNRSVAVAYPELNLSFGCHISGMSEVKTGNFTHMYDNQTRCRFVPADLSDKWNDPEFEDKYLRDQVQDSNVSESNETSGQ